MKRKNKTQKNNCGDGFRLRSSTNHIWRSKKTLRSYSNNNPTKVYHPEKLTWHLTIGIPKLEQQHVEVMGLIRGPYRSQFFFSNWDCEHFARYYIHSYHLQLAKISPFFTSFVCRYSIGEYREFIFYGVDWTNSNIHLISLQLLRQGTVSTPGPWSYLWFVDFLHRGGKILLHQMEMRS